MGGQMGSLPAGPGEQVPAWSHFSAANAGFASWCCCYAGICKQHNTFIMRVDEHACICVRGDIYECLVQLWC